MKFITAYGIFFGSSYTCLYCVPGFHLKLMRCQLRVELFLLAHVRTFINFEITLYYLQQAIPHFSRWIMIYPRPLNRFFTFSSQTRLICLAKREINFSTTPSSIQSLKYNLVSGLLLHQMLYGESTYSIPESKLCNIEKLTRTSP